MEFILCDQEGMEKINRNLLHGKELANLFGLEDLRAGRHPLKNSPHGEPSGSLWVKYLWTVEIMPSFDENSILCAVKVEGEHSTNAQRWIRILYATPNTHQVFEVDEDPLSDGLGNFDLVPEIKHLTLDGISYKLIVESLAVRSVMLFSNPSTGKLRDFESRCYSAAAKLVGTSSNLELKQSVKCWRSYANF